jgi:hypothetical protein
MQRWWTEENDTGGVTVKQQQRRQRRSVRVGLVKQKMKNEKSKKSCHFPES